MNGMKIENLNTPNYNKQGLVQGIEPDVISSKNSSHFRNEIMLEKVLRVGTHISKTGLQRF